MLNLCKLSARIGRGMIPLGKHHVMVDDNARGIAGVVESIILEDAASPQTKGIETTLYCRLNQALLGCR